MKQLSVVAGLLAVLLLGAIATAGTYTRYSEIPPGTSRTADLSEELSPAPTEHLTLTYWNSRAAFQAAFPGLIQEDFSNTNVPANSVVACSGPFNSATNNACFSPGDIVDGITIDNLNGGDNVVLTPPFHGVTSVSVGPNTFAHDAVISFTTTTRAFGADVFDPNGLLEATIEVFGPSGSLGSTLVMIGGFWGVSSSAEDITRIEFRGTIPVLGELFANVEFGVGGVTPTNPSTWGTIKKAYGD